ncbi:MAG: hypothetical protein KJO43_07685 [Phycisphaerae bacterium]|nr:hypothetical protein [Phycisphaerae bacterium]
MDAPPEPKPTRAGEAFGVEAEPFEPVDVRFRLADGIRISGALTGWDDHGFDGSFGRRQWSDVDHRDAWRLLRRLSDDENAEAWLTIGRILLRVGLDQPDARERAERAFVRARQLDPEITARVALTRAEVARIAQGRVEREAAEEKARLATDHPEGRAWGTAPWPTLSDSEQEAAIFTMQADASRILARAGMDIAPVETKYFLFYSDMPRRASVRWSRELDLMYVRLARQFGLSPEENIFWGKAVVFVFNDRDRFRLVEAQAFGQLAPEWADGFCHPIGPKVFVSFYRQADDFAFAALLVHETVHGFMHRYRTPRRLPTWANEGIADYLASVLFRNSPIDLMRRQKGLRFVRAGGDVNGVLDRSYQDGSWPGPDNMGYPIGYLLVELMIRDRPGPFAAWVNAVKDGAPWETALAEEFGVSRERLVDTFVRFYRVND